MKLGSHFNTWKDANNVSLFETEKIRSNSFDQTSETKIRPNFFDQSEKTPIQWNAINPRRREHQQYRKTIKNKFQHFIDYFRPIFHKKVDLILPRQNSLSNNSPSQSGLDNNLQWNSVTNNNISNNSPSQSGLDNDLQWNSVTRYNISNNSPSQSGVDNDLQWNSVTRYNISNNSPSQSGVDNDLQWNSVTRNNISEKTLPSFPNYDYTRWIPIVNNQNKS